MTNWLNEELTNWLHDSLTNWLMNWLTDLTTWLIDWLTYFWTDRFFDSCTWKSVAKLRYFVQFHFKMCFAPQRRALFRHQNFKKCSETVSFLTFSPANVRFATAACTFSTCWLQKVLRTRGVLYIFTCKCAFRHSGVHFLLSLCEARTSAPAALTGLLFHWPDTRIIEKTQHFATSLTFRANVSSFFWLSDYCIFCRLTWLLDDCAFHLLFNSPYCRKFLFKLPSIIYIYIYIGLMTISYYIYIYIHGNNGSLDPSTYG